MKKFDKYDLWTYREAPTSEWKKKIILIALIVAGCISILHLFNWWFREENVVSLPLFILLSIIFWWGMARTIVVWISYIGIKKPEVRPAKRGHSVAIFTTSSPGEPLSMFEKTLAACARIEYPHTTYLLDDTRDPRFREVAERNGAVWLELVGLPGAKAGKVNVAIQKTTEDFILVLDPDHIPFPNFLDKVLGFFDDEKIGFVQVAQAYYNQYRSFTAKAAAEQTYGFYGPNSMGMNGYNCAVAIGANCTFRRKALESAGGHGIGLAEDLITAIRIHAAGWKSVFTPIIVSRGLVPEDLGSFCKQQRKWSRGVHEVLFAELIPLWRKLSGWQRLSYLAVSTYYLSGFITMLFLIIPYLFLWFGWLPANMNFMEFVLNWIPVAIMSVSIYVYVQHWMCHPETERGLHWRGMFLKFACWPVFLQGFLLSLIDADIPYIPTAKQAVKGLTSFIRPHIVHQVLFFLTFILIVVERKYFTAEAKISLTSGEIWGMVAFASIAFLMTMGPVYAAVESKNLTVEEPWKEIDLDAINTNGQIAESKVSPLRFSEINISPVL